MSSLNVSLYGTSSVGTVAAVKYQHLFFSAQLRALTFGVEPEEAGIIVLSLGYVRLAIAANN